FVTQFTPLAAIEDTDFLPGDRFILTDLLGSELGPIIESPRSVPSTMAQADIPAGAGENLHPFALGTEVDVLGEAVGLNQQQGRGGRTSQVRGFSQRRPTGDGGVRKAVELTLLAVLCP